MSRARLVIDSIVVRGLPAGGEKTLEASLRRELARTLGHALGDLESRTPRQRGVTGGRGPQPAVRVAEAMPAKLADAAAQNVMKAIRK